MRRYGKARSRVRRRFIKRRRRYPLKKTFLRRRRRFFKKRVETKYKDVNVIASTVEAARLRANSISTYSPGAWNIYNDPSSTGGNLRIFPVINEGTGRDERVGSRIYLQGFSIHMRFKQQPYTNGNGRIRIVIYQMRGDACYQQVDALKMFKPNELSYPSVIDADSFYDPEYKHKFRIIHDKKYSIRPDTQQQFFPPVPNDPNLPDEELSLRNTQVMHKDIRIKKRFGRNMYRIEHPVYWSEQSPSNNPQLRGDFGMIILCDRGNCGTFDLPTMYGPDDKRLTGYEVTWTARWYWTDQ